MSRNWARRRSRLPVRSHERAAQLAKFGLEPRARDHHLAGLVDQPVQQLRAHAHRLVRGRALRREIGRSPAWRAALAARTGSAPGAAGETVPGRSAAVVSIDAISWRERGGAFGRDHGCHAAAHSIVEVGLHAVEALRAVPRVGRRQVASEPRYSISDSMRCASSPSRKAPASRALPLSVCKTRSTSSRALRLSGRAVHCRSAPPELRHAVPPPLPRRSGTGPGRSRRRGRCPRRPFRRTAVAAAGIRGDRRNSRSFIRLRRQLGRLRIGYRLRGLFHDWRRFDGDFQLEVGEIAVWIVLGQVGALGNVDLLQSAAGSRSQRGRAASGNRRRTGAAGAGFPRRRP